MRQNGDLYDVVLKSKACLAGCVYFCVFHVLKFKVLSRSCIDLVEFIPKYFIFIAIVNGIFLFCRIFRLLFMAMRAIDSLRSCYFLKFLHCQRRYIHFMILRKFSLTSYLSEHYMTDI